jgi:hypothetical protein
MIEGTCEYYRRRADEQGALGRQAASPKAAVAHYELAYRYALLSREPASAAFRNVANG